MKKTKQNAWSPIEIGNFTVKYSKENKTWQVWKGKNLIIDFKLKKSAKSYAEKRS